ncbi:hypothetical protein [Cnuella takakiae]|nr:hypothetical protein [Cnuella takakiae]OLY95528.1 hypothetical protein BUE76_00545 [Cnuella takakiae]
MFKKLLPIFLFFTSCQTSPLDQYQQLVKKEANGKKANDLFLNISFGMPSKDFYLHCWNMNKKGLFADGANNTSVLYKVPDSLMKHPTDMYFYPEFNRGKVSGMWVRFQYAGWAPWNKALASDSLLPDVVQLYQRWYPGGNSFLKIEDQAKGTLYVKVDGNRRIIIGKYDDVQVKVDYTDLSVQPQKAI